MTGGRYVNILLRILNVCTIYNGYLLFINPSGVVMEKPATIYDKYNAELDRDDEQESYDWWVSDDR